MIKLILTPEQHKQLQALTKAGVYTVGEEILHSLTHGIGTALSIAGLTLLLVLASLFGNVYQMVSFSIYGATLILMYLASTLYHSFQNPQAKEIFRIIDHASIYLLIAGTYTPFLIVGIRGWWGWMLCLTIWSLAFLGIPFNLLFMDRLPKISLLTYILMGWLCVAIIQDLLASIALGGLIWLALGGVMYTVGVIFYLMQQTPYMHVIWHLFVLAGSICHYIAVLFYLTSSA